MPPVTTPSPLARAQLLTTPTLVYTAPAGQKGVPRAIDVCNTDSPNTKLLTVWIVPSGGSPDDSNMSTPRLPVTYNASKGLAVLDPGDQIYGMGDALGLTMSVFGSFVTGA